MCTSVEGCNFSLVDEEEGKRTFIDYFFSRLEKLPHLFYSAPRGSEITRRTLHFLRERVLHRRAAAASQREHAFHEEAGESHRRNRKDLRETQDSEASSEDLEERKVDSLFYRVCWVRLLNCSRRRVK